MKEIELHRTQLEYTSIGAQNEKLKKKVEEMQSEMTLLE